MGTNHSYQVSGFTSVEFLWMLVSPAKGRKFFSHNSSLCHVQNLRPAVPKGRRWSITRRQSWRNGHLTWTAMGWSSASLSLRIKTVRGMYGLLEQLHDWGRLGMLPGQPFLLLFLLSFSSPFENHGSPHVLLQSFLHIPSHASIQTINISRTLRDSCWSLACLRG